MFSVQETPTRTEDKHSSMSSPLMHIEGFLSALTTADRDGRIVMNKQGTCTFFLYFNSLNSLNFHFSVTVFNQDFNIELFATIAKLHCIMSE